jgi:hypothetical protein
MEHWRSPALETYRILSSVFALVRGCCTLKYQYDECLSKAGYDLAAIWSLAPGISAAQGDHELLCEVRQDSRATETISYRQDADW